MTSSDAGGAMALAKRALEALCGKLAALSLFAIMVLTLADVCGRKLADASVPGSLELTELLMVVVIFTGLPLVSMKGEHVVFDSLDALMSPAVRRVQALVIDALCAAALGGVAWLLWAKATQLSQFGDTTAQLHIPQGPFVYGMSLLCASTALVHVLLFFTPPSSSTHGVDEAEADLGGVL